MDESISSVLSAIGMLSDTGDENQATLDVLVKRLRKLFEESEPSMSADDRDRFEQLFRDFEQNKKS